MLKQILLTRFDKMLEMERLVPMLLITIATVALFAGMTDFEAWTYAAGAFGGVGVGGLIAGKKINPVPVAVDITPQVNP